MGWVSQSPGHWIPLGTGGLGVLIPWAPGLHDSSLEKKGGTELWGLTQNPLLPGSMSSMPQGRKSGADDSCPIDAHWLGSSPRKLKAPYGGSMGNIQSQTLP